MHRDPGSKTSPHHAPQTAVPASVPTKTRDVMQCTMEGMYLRPVILNEVCGEEKC